MFATLHAAPVMCGFETHEPTLTNPPLSKSPENLSYRVLPSSSYTSPISIAPQPDTTTI